MFQVLAADSWIRFDAVTQTISGLATVPYFNGSESTATTLYIQATDSAGLTASTPLTISVSSNHLLRVSNEFSMLIRTDYVFFTNEIVHTMWWAGNLTNYFNQTSDSIIILSVERSELPGVIITWSDNAINNVNPPYTCPLALIDSLYSQLNGEGVQASLNQYLIVSVTLRLRGICVGFTTSTTTPTTSTTPRTTMTTTTPTTTPTTTSTTTTPTTTTTTPTTTSMCLSGNIVSIV